MFISRNRSDKNTLCDLVDGTTMCAAALTSWNQISLPVNDPGASMVQNINPAGTQRVRKSISRDIKFRAYDRRLII